LPEGQKMKKYKKIKKLEAAGFRRLTGVIPNSSENFTFELRQSPGVERS
jgi:hypothetical protein